MKLVDITGQKFGRLTAIKRASNDKNGQQKWLFKCECGKEKIIYSTNVRRGLTQSCGCLQREAVHQSNFIHGLAGTRLYKIWGCMMHRCCNSHDKRFNDYGGRGISVCNMWLNNPVGFSKWALHNGYTDELTLERKEVNGNYQNNSKETCGQTI